MQVDTGDARFTVEHEGRTYYFCSKGCMLDFRDDPEKYLDPSYETQGMDSPDHDA
jgi:Cu+-exporting ATPase